MKREEARKLFDKDKFEEINSDDYKLLSGEGELIVNCEYRTLYFKSIDKSSKEFKRTTYNIKVEYDGRIHIENTFDKKYSIDINSMVTYKALEEALEYSKKQRAKQK